MTELTSEMKTGDTMTAAENPPKVDMGNKALNMDMKPNQLENEDICLEVKDFKLY